MPFSIIWGRIRRRTADGKARMVNQEHTPARGEDPVFGGHEIGIGFSAHAMRKVAPGRYGTGGQAQHPL